MVSLLLAAILALAATLAHRVLLYEPGGSKYLTALAYPTRAVRNKMLRRREADEGFNLQRLDGSAGALTGAAAVGATLESTTLVL